ncbi:MAG: DUF2332 domain-containing protein [Candidatus Rokubacteria bacterium]|nr:DUF2332 domain-containing protein [Candidatus Rokubacteria bacterium]
MRLGASLARLQRYVPTRYLARARRTYYAALPESRRRRAMAHWFRTQARRCRELDSTLYADLLARAAGDLQSGGPCWATLAGYQLDRDSPVDLPALRFMAAVHRLALEGRAPALAAEFAAPETSLGTDRAWRALLDAVTSERDAVRARLHDPVQTNEVGRCRTLLGGFLQIAHATGRPLRLLELGASAGLNLRWDHYRYETSRATWGPASSPVRFRYDFVDGHPSFAIDARVVERRGCDLAPIDASAKEGQLNLLAHVWADQPERLRLLRAAFGVAQQVPVRVDRAPAEPWIAAALRIPAPGVTTVIFHSAFSLYVGRRAWTRLRGAIEEAGRRATPAAPLAWLRLEHAGADYGLRLVTWPGATDRTLATADAHGGHIRWLASA